MLARPINVMGVSRSANRVRLRVLLFMASSHIVLTRETGSTGDVVLKKMTGNGNGE